MPSPTEILAGLTRIANDWLLVAAAWHLILGAALLALSVGRRPSARVGALAIAPLLASVSFFAWWTGNPFNGLSFALATALAVGLAWRMGDRPIVAPPTWARALGCAMIGFGWAYPHFLSTRPLWVYLVAAPLGLVPCPTVSVAIGLSLLAGSFGSRSWAVALGTLGLFYGVFGALRLGVWIDGALIVGAIGLLVVGLRRA